MAGPVPRVLQRTRHGRPAECWPRARASPDRPGCGRSPPMQQRHHAIGDEALRDAIQRHRHAAPRQKDGVRPHAQMAMADAAQSLGHLRPGGPAGSAPAARNGRDRGPTAAARRVEGAPPSAPRSGARPRADAASPPAARTSTPRLFSSTQQAVRAVEAEQPSSRCSSATARPRMPSAAMRSGWRRVMLPTVPRTSPVQVTGGASAALRSGACRRQRPRW